MVKIVKRSNAKPAKKGNGTDGRGGTKYVYPASRRLIFLVAGEPFESKYSYGVPIIPLYGKYKAKGGKVYDAGELRGEKVVLNVDKDDGLVDEIRNGVKLVAVGYKESEVLVAESDGEDGEEE